MQRIQPTENPQGKAEDLLNRAEKAAGARLNIFKLMANAPCVLESYLEFSRSLFSGKLSEALRESIALCVAGYNGCDYCASAHTAMGQRAGLSEDELARNLRGQSSDSRTQAALDFCKAILDTHGGISEADLQACRDAGFSDEECCEIQANVCLNIFTNYFNRCFGTEVDLPKHVSAQEARRAA